MMQSMWQRLKNFYLFWIWAWQDYVINYDFVNSLQ